MQQDPANACWRPWRRRRTPAFCIIERVSFFLHGGTIYTDVELEIGCSQQVFDRDTTDDIRCNTYAIALSKGAETAVFVAADTHQAVTLELGPGVAGKPRVISLTLDAGEATLIRVSKG